MLLCGSIKEVGPCRYKYIGQVYRFRSLADLEKLSIAVVGDLRRFLNGSFIWVEPDGEQIPERLETPQGMTARLNNPRGASCRWSAESARLIKQGMVVA